MIGKFLRFGLLAAMALPMAACATAPEGPVGFAEPPPPAYAPPPPSFAPTRAAYDEILPELPADAAPGECYAKVVVPGQPIAQPPSIPSATWVMRPGPAGPVWCLVPLAPVPQPALATISREGWIRVLCDTDATPERIGRLQHSLHDRGYYRGGYSGRYDRETVEAVTRFQSHAHIAHGGYLSLETVQALDAPYAGPPVYADAGAGAYAGAQAYAGAGAYASAGAGGYATSSGYPPAYAQPPVMPYGFQSGYRSGYASGPAYSYGPPVGYPPQAYGPPGQGYPPCCAAAGGYQSGYGESYGGYDSYGYSNRGFGGVNSPAVQNGWLVWGGKTTF